MVEAIFNGIALICMLVAVFHAKKKNYEAHKGWMMAALTSSAIFLGCYLVYHILGQEKAYEGEWPLVYYPILITHIILAAIVPILVGMSVYLGISDQRERHRRWVRWSFPIWVYVSVTGIAVYIFVHT